MKYKSIIESVKEYITLCPHIEDLMLLESLDNVAFWTIEEGPNHKTNLSQNYIDGDCMRVFRFSFTASFSHLQEVKTAIEYSGFYEQFQEWVEKNNHDDILPILRNGLSPISIEILTTGYFIYPKQSEDKMKYQIQLQLLYEKENEVWIA